MDNEKNPVWIWKRRYSPFRMGGKSYYNVRTLIDDYSVIELGKGFQGIYIPGQGVFELQSGGLIGDTIEDVEKDISTCHDIEFMRKQVEQAKVEGASAELVTYEDFCQNN